MIRLISTILLSCLLLVCGGQAASAAGSAPTGDGVDLVQVHAGMVLSIAEQAEELLDSDPTCSVVDVLLAVDTNRRAHTRPAVHAPTGSAIRTGDTPVYIAHRRILI